MEDRSWETGNGRQEMEDWIQETRDRIQKMGDWRHKKVL